MSENSLTSYRAWRRYIGEVELKLDTGKNGYQRLYLVAIAERIARHGANGIGCYPSNKSIAEELGTTRVTVDKYKDLAIALGWFTDTGKRKRRIPVLDIAIPGEVMRPVDSLRKTTAQDDAVVNPPWTDDDSEPELPDDDLDDNELAPKWRAILNG